MDHPENAALPIIVRAYGMLNDFLPRARRGQLVAIPYAEHETVKHVVEVVGIPHPEIEALLVNGTPVNFTARVQPGDHIDVYPPGNEPPALALRPPLVVPHFILDVHLGRLAAYLRMLGLDTRYSNDQDDPDLAQIASEENRVLLTRDIGLLKRSAVIYGAFVRATNPEAQLREIVDRYHLRRAGATFQRCLSCNGRTVWVAKEAIIDQLQPKTRRYYDMFWQCEDCRQIYWHGSHVVRMQEVIRRVFDDPQALA
ncbi:MAG: Mut7-C ubiquitin/RNAse domain-containing protein [Oscillochloris sp.]|nr:Mut7-C ubiquitin/RNAse domain-containing protein [Oscillochloris sp.]